MDGTINISHNFIAFKQKLHLKVSIEVVRIIKLDITRLGNRENESCSWRLK
jgi:hypothetical protein